MNMVQFLSELLSLTRSGDVLTFCYSALFLTPDATEAARFVASNLALGMCPLPTLGARIELCVERLGDRDHIHVMITHDGQENAFERTAAFMEGQLK